MEPTRRNIVLVILYALKSGEDKKVSELITALRNTGLTRRQIVSRLLDLNRVGDLRRKDGPTGESIFAITFEGHETLYYLIRELAPSRAYQLQQAVKAAALQRVRSRA